MKIDLAGLIAAIAAFLTALLAIFKANQAKVVAVQEATDAAKKLLEANK